MSTEKNEILDLQESELRQMLQEKIAELNEANAEVNKARKEVVNMQSRALKVHEENQMLQHSPQYAAMAAEMKYQLNVAKKFIESGAFPNQTPEQLYVKMKAGKEMGMGEIESVNSLYFVNGKLEPYGKGMIALLTSKGYRLKYVNESPEQCTAIAIDKDGNEYEETANANDPIIQRSKAARISMKNKLRFHAVRTILNFQLPHLIQGLPDLFENDAMTANKDNNGNTMVLTDDEILAQLDSCPSIEQLKGIEEEHLTKITKSITLTSALGKAKKRLEDEQG